MRSFQFKPRHPVARLAFTPDGRYVVTCQPHTAVCVRDVATGDAVRTIKTPGVTNFYSVAFEPDGGHGVVTSDRGGVYFSLECEYGANGGGARCAAAFAGTQLRLGVLHGGRYAVFDSVIRPTPAQSSVLRCYGHGSVARFVGLTSDGRYSIGVRERNRPVLIAVEVGTIAVELDHTSCTKHPVSVTAGPDRLALCDGRTLRVFDTSGLADVVPGKRSKPVLPAVLTVDAPDGVEAWSPPVAFTPDGRGMLVGGPRERVQLWDIPSREKRCEWNWRLEKLMSLAVAPDGLTAAAGGRLGRVVVWDLE